MGRRRGGYDRLRPLLGPLAAPPTQPPRHQSGGRSDADSLEPGWKAAGGGAVALGHHRHVDAAAADDRFHRGLASTMVGMMMTAMFAMIGPSCGP